MKKSISLITLCTLILQLSAQTTIVLQPGLNGKDAHIDNLSPNANGGNSAYINAGYNTVGGTPTLSHDFLQFDLSAIPAGATITDARLSLFHANGNNHSTSTANDEMYAMALSAWAEDFITWNNQPALSTTDTIHIGNTNSLIEDKVGIDIKAFVQQWVNSPTTNNGMALRLIDESVVGRFQSYGSSDNTDSTVRPKLVVTFTACSGHTVLKPGREGKDAHIDNLNPDSNGGYSTYINAGHNTVGGIPTISHGFLQFDLSSIPVGATINSARLSLYHANGNNHSGSTANEELYAMALSSWNEDSITWNNQPALSNTDTVVIGNTNSSTEDKPDINVAAFVQYWVNNPAMNFGMALHLVDEPGALGRFQSYGSGDNADSLTRPMLVVDWAACTTALNDAKPQEESFELYPNPAKEILFIRTPSNAAVNIIVFDISGRQVLMANRVSYIATENLLPGCYLISVSIGDKIITKRFIKY